jgi:Lysozyme inhibitor LprI
MEFEIESMRKYCFMVVLAIFCQVQACAPMRPANAPIHPPRPNRAQIPLGSIPDIEAQMDHRLAEIRRMYARDAEFLAKLEASQVAWRRFRKAYLESLYPASDKTLAYGRTFSRCYQMAYVAVTRQRIEQLQMWIDGRPEGDVCAGSIGYRPE